MVDCVLPPLTDAIVIAIIRLMPTDNLRDGKHGCS